MLLPALLAVAAGVDRKKAIALMPFGVLPDLDALFLSHHLVFHSLIAILLIALPVLVCFRWIRPRYFTAGVLAVLYVCSHLPLDLFFGTYIALFWPLSTVGYAAFINLTVTYDGLWPKIGLGATVSQHLVFNNGSIVDAAMFNSGGFVLAFLFLPAVLYGYGRYMQWRPALQYFRFISSYSERSLKGLLSYSPTRNTRKSERALVSDDLRLAGS